MTTAAALREQTSKDLAQLAKSKGVTGWHSMRKEQLVKALLKLAKDNGKKKPKARPATKSTARTQSRIAKKIRNERLKQESLRDLAQIQNKNKGSDAPAQDRVILVVRDPYWIQAYWEITKHAVERARVALSMLWYDAKPIIRLLRVSEESTSSVVEEVVREIPIHGGVSNWFIEFLKQKKAIESRWVT